MAKHQQQGEPQQNYRPGPLPRQDSQTVRLATLGGVVALLMISFSNWREIDQIQTSLDGKLVQLQTQLAQVSTKVDNVSTRAAAPPPQLGGAPIPTVSTRSRPRGRHSRDRSVPRSPWSSSRTSNDRSVPGSVRP